MSSPHYSARTSGALLKMQYLAPFEELTREISSQMATTSDAIPSVEALKRLLNKSLSKDSGVKTTKTALLEAVKQRFNNIYTEPL